MNRTLDDAPGSDRGSPDLGSPDASGRGCGRVFLLLSIPVVLFAAGVTYLLLFSPYAEQFADIASTERANAVRFAVEHTEPAQVPHLMAAVGRPPDGWDRRQVEAVTDLVERSGWPDVPSDEVDNAGLLSRPPEQWSPAEAASVDDLLQRFRSFHAARR